VLWSTVTDADNLPEGIVKLHSWLLTPLPTSEDLNDPMDGEEVMKDMIDFKIRRHWSKPKTSISTLLRTPAISGLHVVRWFMSLDREAQMQYSKILCTVCSLMFLLVTIMLFYLDMTLLSRFFALLCARSFRAKYGHSLRQIMMDLRLHEGGMPVPEQMLRLVCQLILLADFKRCGEEEFGYDRHIEIGMPRDNRVFSLFIVYPRTNIIRTFTPGEFWEVALDLVYLMAICPRVFEELIEDSLLIFWFPPVHEVPVPAPAPGPLRLTF